MQAADLMQAMLELADEVALEVRVVRTRPGSEEPPLSSAVCRVKGRIWVVLSDADPVDAQLAAIASALRQQCGETLNDRYLPPAIRNLLEG